MRESGRRCLLSVGRLCSDCKIKFWRISATMIWKNRSELRQRAKHKGHLFTIGSLSFLYGCFFLRVAIPAPTWLISAAVAVCGNHLPCIREPFGSPASDSWHINTMRDEAPSTGQLHGCDKATRGDSGARRRRCVRKIQNCTVMRWH